MIAFLLILLLSGCGSSHVCADRNDTRVPLNRELLAGPRVVIDRISVNDVLPPDRSWAGFVEKLQRHISGELVINDLVSVSLAVDADGYLDEGHSVPIDESGLHQITLIFVPKSKDVNRGQYVRFSSNRQVIVYNKEKIEKSAGLFLSKEAIWEIVLLHELGHAMGVPADPSHSWSNQHCTDPHCVMYPRVDVSSVLSAMFFGLPKDFCKKCRAEISEAKREIGDSYLFQNSFTYSTVPLLYFLLRL